jgi:glycosyltransferase involved in cell wall biosynthesis
MSKLKLLFFINGPETGVTALRAKMLAQRLPSDWQIRFNYRPTPKWKGILPFIQSTLQFRPDIIYVMDMAYTGVLAGSISKQLIGCKLVTDTGDVTFELAKSSGSYSPIQLGLIHWIEQIALQQSDCLIVRGSYHKTWLAHQGMTRVEVIPDGIDLATIPEVKTDSDIKQLRNDLGLSNYLVVGLVGSMTWSERHRMCYGWDIIEALAYLKDLPVKGLLVGDGDGRAILEERALQLGVEEQVTFVGKVPYKCLPTYLAAMDVCVSTQSNDLVGMVRTTGKLPLYLACGKYVIATHVGEASRVLPGVGCLLPYEGVRDEQHPIRLANQLKVLLNQPELLRVSHQARQVAQENFDYKVLTKRVERVCADLVQIKQKPC